MGDDIIDITRRQFGKLARLLTGQTHKIQVKTRFTCHMVEVEDLNFHHDSAVMLPDYGIAAPQEGTTAEQERVTGLAVLYACYRHHRDHPEQSILVVGHTDRSGATGYNQVLSEMRADNVRAALRGDRDGWVDICRQKSKVEDYQQILIWLTHSLGWNCDPGGKTNVHDAQTHAAVEAFQTQYNADDRFPNDIDVDGQVGRQTWGAFFDVYMLELQHALGTDAAGLAAAQQALQFTNCEAIGCGEEFPITEDRQENYESPIDRRVEILFFDPGEEPVVNCGSPRGACVELYEKKMYCVTPVPIQPLPMPSGVAVHVFLTITYIDPEGNERAFPEGCPVTVEYANGDSEQQIIGAGGLLEFFALRERQGFTLRFQFPAATYPGGAYMASPQHGTSGAERLLAADAVRGHLGPFFLLPPDFRLADAEWAVTGADTYDDGTSTFQRLDDTSIARIGSAASPVQVVLDPRWLYFKLLYFDRWLKQKLSTPALVVEGFRDRDAMTTGQPDTCSNWVTPAEACQCLPWILTTPSVPDNKKLLQFRTIEQTYIESTGTSSSPSRRLVTKSGAAASSDVGLNRGDAVTTNFDQPNANRLAYYDLPPVWKSRTYFTRLSGGTGAPAARSGRFEDLAGETTTDAQPLLFSLDDIVLTDASLQPITWTPDTQVQNRVAIFCNTFAQSGPSSANLSNVGLYKPDAGNNQSYFTQRPSEETDRNYIADYPDWTRLVITQGNLFDVFDKRLPDTPNGVVGARAGVRYLDVFASSSTFVTPGTTRPGLPPASQRPFITIHPLYEQRHGKWWTGSTSDDRGIGRFDLVLLRCCDIASDNVTEIGQCLNYFRFFFNFNATFESGATPLGLSGNAARAWVGTAISNLLTRWNGPDGSRNPGPAELRAAAAASLKLHVRSLWFAQDLPKAISHYEMGIYQSVRAYMSASRGEGALSQTDNQLTTTTFGHGITLSNVSTFAHETGHGGSLGDEYVEQTSPTSLPVPWLPGFDSFSPGAPFVIDHRAMMVSNLQIRARFFWHLSEWMWDLQGRSTDFDVVHGAHTYRLPHHADAPRKSHVNFPLRAARNQERGDHGRYDVFFYPLGVEHFSANVLPTRAGKPGTFDGIIVVIVKMEFDFDVDNNTTIHNWLTAVQAQLNLRFNYKFYATGSVSGQTYNRCLLHFSPRYLVDDYSAEDPRDDDEHIKVDVPDSGVPEWDSGLFSSDFKLHFPRNQPPHVFARFFAHMLGLADGVSVRTNPNSYIPIARAVIPGANVHSL